MSTSCVVKTLCKQFSCLIKGCRGLRITRTSKEKLGKPLSYLKYLNQRHNERKKKNLVTHIWALRAFWSMASNWFNVMDILQIGLGFIFKLKI